MPRSREILLPWDSQPQESVEVNQGSPYAPKSGLWIPERNIVNGAGVTYGGSGSDPTQTVIQSGRALYTNGKWVQTDIAVASSTFVTWVAVIKPTAGPGGTGFSSFFQTGQYTLNWNHSNSAYRGSLTLYDNGFYPTCKFTGGFTAGVEVVIGGTYDGTTLKVFRSGVLENSLTTTNRTVGASLNALQFLGGVGGTVAFDGACSYFYWDATRALTDAQMAQLMAGIYAETIEPQTIPVPVSAGGGGATDLIIQEALHSHTADNIGLTLDTFLSVQEALHSHAADNLVLSVTGSTDLTVQETLHSHTSDNLALTLDTFLLLQDALHAHAADNITLSTGAVADLVIQEALHAHTADALVLTLDTFLVIQEAAHAHGADNIAFTLDSLLAVQEALHGHLADNLILSIPGSALSDAEFRQMYDWISELHLVHGLRAGNPLTVTPTSRAAGAVDQTIGEVGTTVTVTRI